MLRIHFTADDLARTTLADEPDELWEVLLSLHMLQVEDGPVPYGAWRQRMRRRLPLAEAQPESLHHLAHAVRVYHRPALALYFCWRAPTKLGDHDLPPVLVYPIRNATGLQQDQADEDSAQSLAALLGRTRATVLALTVDGCTTTQLAVACDITLATASHQTAVLREAGLIGSKRIGKSVRHQATALGLALLNGFPD